MKRVFNVGVLIGFFVALVVCGRNVDVWNDAQIEIEERFENTVEQREFVQVLFYDRSQSGMNELLDYCKQMHKEYRKQVFFVVVDLHEHPNMRHIVKRLGLSGVPAVLLFQDGTLIDDRELNRKAILVGSAVIMNELKNFLHSFLDDRIVRVTHERSYPRNDITLNKDTWGQNKMRCDEWDPWFYWNYPYTRGYHGGTCGPGVGGGGYN